jgi:hypothetical protein
MLQITFKIIYKCCPSWFKKLCLFTYASEVRGGVVVKALRYKPAGRGFDCRWFHWNFSVT